MAALQTVFQQLLVVFPHLISSLCLIHTTPSTVSITTDHNFSNQDNWVAVSVGEKQPSATVTEHLSHCIKPSGYPFPCP